MRISDDIIVSVCAAGPLSHTHTRIQEEIRWAVALSRHVTNAALLYFIVGQGEEAPTNKLNRFKAVKEAPAAMCGRTLPNWTLNTADDRRPLSYQATTICWLAVRYHNFLGRRMAAAFYGQRALIWSTNLHAMALVDGSTARLVG